MPGINGTNYSTAFDALQADIVGDSHRDSQQKYVVVFMSDGEPSDMGSESEIDSNITQEVKSLQTNVSRSTGGNVIVSSVYFGDKSLRKGDSAYKAAYHLQVMAAQGGGQFVDTTKLNAELQIEDLIKVTSRCQ